MVCNANARDTHSLDQTSLGLASCGKAFYTLSDRPITGQVVTANCVVRYFTRLATAEAQGAGTSRTTPRSGLRRRVGRGSGPHPLRTAVPCSITANERREKTFEERNKTMDCT